jgi:hypothetical protein
MYQNEDRIEETLTKIDVLNRASAGFDFMNKNVPHWQCLIDDDQLDMSNGRKCPLGQCFGNYREGLNELCASLGYAPDPVKLGFGMTYRTPDLVGDEPYFTVLTRCWKELLGDARTRRQNCILQTI